MRGISEKRLIKKLEETCQPSYRDVLNQLIDECQELNPWMTLEEFLKSGFEGLCWVCYENKHVYDGTYIKKGNYFYHDFEITFDYEDVTDVQPIHKPEPPR